MLIGLTISLGLEKIAPLHGGSKKIKGPGIIFGLDRKLVIYELISHSLRNVLNSNDSAHSITIGRVRRVHIGYIGKDEGKGKRAFA